MSIRWIWLLAMLASHVAVTAGGTVLPAVDARVMEVGATRHQGTLWRYARFSTESDYPCLRFEAIDPDQGWHVSERRDICNIRLQGGAVCR